MIHVKVTQSAPVKITTDAQVTVSDGGYERGYEAGYKAGNSEGYAKGYDDGLTKRTYEVWTITLVDGTVIEKEVALL